MSGLRYVDGCWPCGGREVVLLVGYVACEGGMLQQQKENRCRELIVRFKLRGRDEMVDRDTVK